MNSWQVARQLAYRLRSRNWTGTSTPVFGRVWVTSEADAEMVGHGIFPVALVRPGAATSDPSYGEEPDLLRQAYIVRVLASVAGDPTGETAIVGSHRTGTPATSNGRGVLEVEEEVFAAVEALVSDDGVHVYSRSASAVAVDLEPELGMIAGREYELEALVSADRFYHPPTRLAATAPGGGQAALTWRVPPDRFDRYRVVLRRAAGATPPSSITDGTGVTLASNLATSVTDTPGVGVFSYALFGTYDDSDDPPDSDDFASAADTVTVTTT